MAQNVCPLGDVGDAFKTVAEKERPYHFLLRNATAASVGNRAMAVTQSCSAAADSAWTYS